MTDAVPQKLSPRQRAVAFLRKHGLALLVTLLFAFGNWAMEDTPPSRWLQFQAFSGLNALLPSFEAERLPVIVVNFHELPSEQGQETNRKQLQSVIDQIADQQPAAIGIDIDFSPQGDTPPSPADEAFLDFCNDLTKGKRDDRRKAAPIPIFLGIQRTVDKSPPYWLGQPDYEGLAAAISMPPTDTRRLPRWFTSPTYGDKVYLRSMAEALAESYLGQQRMPMPAPAHFAWLVETMSSNPRTEHSFRVGGEEKYMDPPAPEGFRKGASLTNYSKLEELKREEGTVNLRGTNAVVSGDFRGRIVLLGDTDTGDTFTDPGLTQPFRGVYLHACAVYTYIRKPLYEFNIWFRTGLDIGLSIVLVMTLSNLDELSEAGQRKRQRRHLGVLGVTLLLGWLLVLWTGILWLDFIAILIALLLHPSAEMHLQPLWEKGLDRLLPPLEAPDPGSSEAREAITEQGAITEREILPQVAVSQAVRDAKEETT